MPRNLGTSSFPVTFARAERSSTTLTDTALRRATTGGNPSHDLRTGLATTKTTPIYLCSGVRKLGRLTFGEGQVLTTGHRADFATRIFIGSGVTQPGGTVKVKKRVRNAIS